LKELYPLLTYILVVTFTPGPNNIMAMANGMRFGYKKSLPFLSGIFCGFLSLGLLSGILNVMLADLLPASGKWLKFLGAAYMLYLAYHVFRSGPIDEGESEKKTIGNFWFGFSMQFMNVKGILYLVSVFSMFMTIITPNPTNILLFALFLGLVSFASVSVWATGGNLLRSFASKHYRIINIIMGGALVYTAVASLI
jgi:threonine/homoserine/homoserine lactone efflux protein